MSRTEVGRRRPINGIQDIAVGDHVCWAYNDDVAYTRVLARYATAGLAASHRVACFVPAARLEQLHADLCGVPGLDVAARSGALILGSAEDAYLPGGTFDPDLRIEGYASMVDEALRDGFGGLSVMGDATRVVSDPVSRERWPSYELRADMLTAHHPLIALCAYDIRACDLGALAVMHGLHPSSYGTWGVESPFHVFAGPDGSLAVEGDLDFLSSGPIARVAIDAASDVPEPILDLTRLGFIDVAGLRALLRGLQAMAARHRVIRIRGAGPTFKRMWQLLACDRQVEVVFDPS